MLSIEDIEQFADKIRSGELEEEFRDSPEFKRHEILELLEKIMDLSDLCDEAATRMIFRTPQQPPSANSSQA